MTRFEFRLPAITSDVDLASISFNIEFNIARQRMRLLVVWQFDKFETTAIPIR